MKTPGFIAAALAVTGIMIILTERLKKYGLPASRRNETV